VHGCMMISSIQLIMYRDGWREQRSTAHYAFCSLLLLTMMMRTAGTCVLVYCNNEIRENVRKDRNALCSA